jgi:hypothetical protein
VSAFEELQAQLLASVAERQTHTAVGAYSRMRLKRRAGPRRGLLLAGIPLVFVAAAAAATIATHAGEAPTDALFNRVMSTTSARNTAVCRSVGWRVKARLSAEAPDPRITAVLPELASAPARPPTAKTVALAEHLSGGAVLARTLREVTMPDGITLIVFVAHGQGPFTVLTPQACLAARLARLAQLDPNQHDPVRVAVAGKIREFPDTNVALESLSLFHGRHGSLEGGGSLALAPHGRALATGVVSWGYSCTHGRCSPDLYDGVVGPSTAYLTLIPAGRAGPHRGRVHRRIPVVDGLFVFSIAQNSGHETLIQHAADGRVLSSRALR